MRKADITYTQKLTELKLDLTHPNNERTNYILVEGDSDIRLFRKFFNPDRCKVETVPGGNTKLEECVDELSNAHPTVLGIRDADFIRLNKNLYSKRNMFLTDFHDIEVTMLSFNKVISSLLYEYYEKIILPEKFRLKVLHTIRKLGALKYINEKEALSLSFKPGFLDLISFNDGDIDIAKYIDRVLGVSPNAKLSDSQEILRLFSIYKQTDWDLLQLTNGHDFIRTLTFIFNTGKYNRQVNFKDIESSIRIVFEKSDFEKTKLYDEILHWQSMRKVSLF